ncbi:hypothetical protein YC2023_043249 [Brassica napus]
MSQLQAILEMNDKLQKQKILDRLLAKRDPLSEMESSLKLKLMAEMFSSNSQGRSHGIVKVVVPHVSQVTGSCISV